MGKGDFIRNALSLVLGIAFINIGVDHFINPEWYYPLVPEILGSARFWVLFSGVWEIGFGIALIIPKFREYAAVFGVWMLVGLYWANANMWINDIPLDGENYGIEFHIIRLIIQILLILVIAWIGEITPFKDETKGLEGIEIFEGRISSCAFKSGDRIVVGDWYDSPFGRFTDIMWAKPDGTKTLIAPNQEIADYVNAMYSFDETLIEEINVDATDNTLKLDSNTMQLDFAWNNGFPIPIKRSLLFIATVELFFAKLFFGTKTHGITNNNRKEWYAIDRVSKITSGTGKINGKDLGEKTLMSECKFGFSEAPKKPSSCKVRTHIL